MTANGSAKYTFAKWRTILHTLYFSVEMGYRGAKCDMANGIYSMLGAVANN